MDTTLRVIRNNDLIEVRRRLDSEGIQISNEYLPMLLSKLSTSKKPFDVVITEVMREIKADQAEAEVIETYEAEAEITENADFDRKVRRIGTAGNLLIFLFLAVFIIGELLLDAMTTPLWIVMLVAFVAGSTLLLVWATFRD